MRSLLCFSCIYHSCRPVPSRPVCARLRLFSCDTSFTVSIVQFISVLHAFPAPNSLDVSSRFSFMFLSFTNKFLIVSQWFPAIFAVPSRFVTRCASYALLHFPEHYSTSFLFIPPTFPFVFRCVLSCPTLCVLAYETRAFFDGFLVGSLRR